MVNCYEIDKAIVYTDWKWAVRLTSRKVFEMALKFVAEQRIKKCLYPAGMEFERE